MMQGDTMNIQDRTVKGIARFCGAMLLIAIMAVVTASPCLADTGITGISQGSSSTFILKDDSTLWSCGLNYQGRLGDGFHIEGASGLTLTDNTNTAMEMRCVLGPTFISVCKKAIAGDGGMALKNDGIVWTWGSNRAGTRGYETGDYFTPAAIPNMTEVRDIAGSSRNSFAIKEDGTVWAWGGNYRGSLGDGTTEARLNPVQVQGLPDDIVEISASGIHTLALDSSGNVWAWGCNREGGLGDGTTTDSYVPEQIPIDHVISIQAYGTSSVALKDDGTVWTWGGNTLGYLGDGSGVEYRSMPVRVAGLTGVIAISAGRNVLALKDDGTVWSWGRGTAVYGNGGEDYDYLSFNTPGKVNITDAAAIYCGSGYFVLKKDGSLWAWGLNGYGELGIGNFYSVLDPEDPECLNVWYATIPTRVLTEPGATPLPEITPPAWITATMIPAPVPSGVMPASSNTPIPLPEVTAEGGSTIIPNETVNASSGNLREHTSDLPMNDTTLLHTDNVTSDRDTSPLANENDDHQEETAGALSGLFDIIVRSGKTIRQWLGV